jgi:trehalose synthase
MVPKTPATTEYKLATVADYEPLIGAAAVDRLGRKAEASFIADPADERLRDQDRLAGAPGPSRFLQRYQKDAQGAARRRSQSERSENIYEEVVLENAMRMHLDHDLVVVHDPQPRSLSK